MFDGRGFPDEDRCQAQIDTVGAPSTDEEQVAALVAAGKITA